MRMLGPLCTLALLACAPPNDAAAAPDPSSSEPSKQKHARRDTAAPPVKTESSLGVSDQGVFSDLDDRTQIALSGALEKPRVRAILDDRRSVLILFEGDWPVKIYPTLGPAQLRVGATTLSLRPGDKEELAPLLGPSALQVQPIASKDDRDDDGIPNVLDVLVGAIKTVHNGAHYGGGYRRIAFPGGDIPREDGVCTDVVIRAVRNAGLDTQEELQRDIKRSPASFPMVKKRNPNIDHRRVKTLLPYFVRQWEAHSKDLDDTEDPVRPGDIIFMDTFPKRRGPDHIGVVSNRRGPSGHLLVINNWTNGFQTSEMDLLSFVPVTHRFRMR